ncbi:hypothetical protein AQUCO_02500224v1 [Aquilegia coerulea]|uniref:Uncharacterized protein n=2 Tax=Aquilegia coerulea TaxID=218851 RepID=A0A2G5DA34_AQUCA|nr:hypothetical protein AQUCO_02500224v1 [Aquilegia coerulea]
MLTATRLLPCSALLSSATTTTTTTSTTSKTCNPNGRILTPILIKPKKTRIFAVYSNENSDTWEEPDGGSNSDYEEDDEWDSEQESSFDVISGSNSTSSLTNVRHEDEHFIKEVEHLLTPDERAILQQNETPDLSKISTRKWGVLQTLALSQQIPFMDKLLVQGVDIDAPDQDGLTALHKAVIGKREAVISHLLRKGANPHVRDKDGATPLHYAVQVGAMQTVKLLIKYKVDVNTEDNEGWTPLHVAIQSRSRDIAKILLVNGADKTRRTKDGTSVLDLSLCYGKDFKSYELTKLVKLVPAGIDP